MASLVLTVGGSALGNALLPGIGGALLGGVGAYLGGQIDGAVFGNSKVTGPRLENLKIQDSTYGKSIPILYGNARVAGNIIWSSDLIETLSNDSVGGKGGGGSATSVRRASYAVDCAIALGIGANNSNIGGIRTIWADSKIIYNDGAWNANIVADAEFYLGTTTQTPSPLMESYLGVANVPAYRGIAYVVLHRLQLANFGNRIPNLTVEYYPADLASAPRYLGAANPNILSRPSTLSSFGAMPALPIARSGAGVARMLVGGVIQSGTSFQFVAIEMDVTGSVPVEINRSVSATVIRSGDLSDISWALSPDGQSVISYMQHSDASFPASFVVYKIATRNFGNIVTDNLSYSSALNQIAWLDEQHVIIPETASGQLGVRVYALSGTTPVALGFFGVWGSGSSTTRFSMPFAQFCKLSGGVCFLAADSALSPNTIYARTLRWQNNTLIIGSENILTNTVGGFATTNVAILPLSANEFVLARMSTNEIRLLSFTVSFASLAITRAWTSIAITPTGNFSISIRDGRLGFIHAPASSSTYRYGEIIITASSFTLTVVSTLVSGSYSGVINNVSFYPVDATRYVLQASGGSGTLSRVALFERGQAEQNLSVILADILSRAGYAAGDYDVSALNNASVQGYVLGDVASARAAIEPLQTYQAFDIIESDGVLKAKLYRTTVDAALSSGEARAAEDNQEQPPALVTSRAQELDLPREVSIDFLDPALDFQRGTQRAQRIASNARTVENMRLPVVCPALKAKQIAESQLIKRWIERNLYEISLSRNYAQLDAGDVVSFFGQVMRLTQINQQGGIIKTQAVPVSDLVSSTATSAEGGKGSQRDVLGIIPSTVYVLNIPLLRSTDDQPGYYVGISGQSGWPGAALMRATDGINYSLQDSFSLPMTAGIATSVLAQRNPWIMDRASTVTVSLLRGSLSSCSEADLLNGSNAALLGDEIIQFQTAILNSDGSVTLSNLLRGRKGTESEIGTHIIGERFILLQNSSLHFLPLNANDKGRTFYFRAPSVGQDVGVVADTVYIPQMKHLQPLAPDHLKANRNSALDITLNWKRRARSNAEWTDLIDVPLDEATELYDLEIMNGSNVVRTFANLTTNSVSYTAAQQISDFGAVQSVVTCKVYQLSARFGRGAVFSATI